MANKKQYVVKLRLSDDLLRRLLLVSEVEGRTLNNQLTLLARNAVAYHERAKGRLDPKALAAVDLSEYEQEDTRE